VDTPNDDYLPLNCTASPSPVPANTQTVHASCIWHTTRPCGPGLLLPTAHHAAVRGRPLDVPEGAPV